MVGGCYQIGNEESTADSNLSARFMKTVVGFCPSIVNPGDGVEGLHIIRHGVGLRPVRRDGPRIEKEYVKCDSDGVVATVIHCYGHGGFGYQTSWASGEEVVKLVQEASCPAKAKI